jgi:hypothetical protein
VRDAGQRAAQVIGVQDTRLCHESECSPAVSPYWPSPLTAAG